MFYCKICNVTSRKDYDKHCTHYLHTKILKCKACKRKLNLSNYDLNYVKKFPNNRTYCNRCSLHIEDFHDFLFVADPIEKSHVGDYKKSIFKLNDIHSKDDEYRKKYRNDNDVSSLYINNLVDTAIKSFRRI